ncbi:hypothetical protein niasHS_000216 [Heterodera schachtii]|uniref:Uncharacterized protein n=1 Tax=Heterodera schachtii TaxID=97005 RepID=A0ABD2KBG6_HETSC
MAQQWGMGSSQWAMVYATASQGCLRIDTNSPNGEVPAPPLPTMMARRFQKPNAEDSFVDVENTSHTTDRPKRKAAEKARMLLTKPKRQRKNTAAEEEVIRTETGVLENERETEEGQQNGKGTAANEQQKTAKAQRTSSNKMGRAQRRMSSSKTGRAPRTRSSKMVKKKPLRLRLPLLPPQNAKSRPKRRNGRWPPGRGTISAAVKQN